jgi:Tat protein secretion system quality control protein TatD with DNase activity
VLETDSPFLYRGERNSPVNVLESAEAVSEILDVPETDVVEETAGNTRELFDLE